jgi:hypothetical protein
MEAYGGVEIQIHILLTSVLDGGEWSSSPSSRLTPGETDRDTDWLGDRVGPRAGMDFVEKGKSLAYSGSRNPIPGLSSP